MVFAVTLLAEWWLGGRQRLQAAPPTLYAGRRLNAAALQGCVMTAFGKIFMRRRIRHGTNVACLAIASLLATAPIAPAAACDDPKAGLGVAREIKIDTSGGPIFGGITKYAREPRFLGPKEVVLTFDDGPVPRITRSILKTLREFCTKAMFFPVGRMAIAYPQTVREIVRDGHTLGAHTWSHPYNLRRVKRAHAAEQVEKGFAAIAIAAGRPIAPFFRFPGLNDDPGVLKHLQARGIATFSVDVVSDDSYETDPRKLIQQTIARAEKSNGGIMLFHDIKMTTALALPAILDGLKKRGFKVVHLSAKSSFTPVGDYDEALNKKFAAATRSKPLPRTVLRAPLHTVAAFAVARPPVTELAPSAKVIELASVRKKRLEALRGAIAAGGWATVVERPHARRAAAKPSN